MRQTRLDFVKPQWAGRGRAAFDGWHGSMKPEGRRKTMAEDRRIRLRRWLRSINFTVHRKGKSLDVP